MLLRTLRHSLLIALLALTSRAGAQSEPFRLPPELDLNAALRLALERNFDILRAKELIEEQNGLVIEVRARALPDVAFEGQYLELDEGLSDPFFPPTTTRWSFALNARQTLYSGGGVRAALEVQRLIEEAALLELQAVINDVMLLTRESFYGALLARARIGVQEENVALLEELLANARNRFEAGSDSQFEVLRAEVELANARPALIQARNDFRIGIEELRELLGAFSAENEDMRQTPELVGELRYAPRDYDLGNALETARAERPEILRLAKVAEAREEGVTIARAGHRPELSLIGAYQFNKPNGSASFDKGLDGWVAGLEVRVPIFDGHRTRGQVRQARSQRAQAELDLRQFALSVEVEVRRALSELQAASELAEASVKVIEQAEEALKLADLQYEAGDATQLDVLQARVSLTEARLNQAEANYRYQVAEAQVRRAIGVAAP